MKKIALTMLTLLVLGSSQAFAGKIVADSLSSKILGATVKCNVYIPDGFEESDATYPSVYLLHGLYGTWQDWENLGRMKLVADELMSSGEATKMVIIMPNAGHPDVHHEWNGYFNMPGWSYEDFFFQELVPAMEAKYRCIGDKAHRAVMGLSMGGGGSTVYCQRHPDMFSSCYAMSAWLDNGDAQIRADQDPEDKLYLVGKSVSEHSALAFIENADEETLSRIRTVKWFFDCGDDDFLLDLSVKLHLLMRRSRVKSELRVHNGVHNWEYWHLALRDALPFASRNFGEK